MILALVIEVRAFAPTDAVLFSIERLGVHDISLLASSEHDAEFIWTSRACVGGDLRLLDVDVVTDEGSTQLGPTASLLTFTCLSKSD